MARHVGQHVETGEHLVIHFMLIPEQTTQALVSETAKVPEPMRSTMLRALGESQGPEDLGAALSRRLYADTNKSIFQVLHETGMLKAVEIDKIVMTPDGNHRIPLRAVLEAVGSLPKNPGTSADMAGPEVKFNPHTYNTAAMTSEETIQQAHNLLAEAQMLEGDAQAKRMRAYALAPSLNPEAQAPAAPAVEAPSAEDIAKSVTETPPADPEASA